MSLPYHHGDLKAALIARARQHISEKGFGSFSLREISREACVSHAAAYRHFPDKDVLLAQVAEQGFLELALSCEVAASLHAGDPVARLGACGLAYVTFGQRNPRLMHLMFTSLTSSSFGRSSASLKAASAASFGILNQVIADGQAQGKIRGQDSRSVALSCWAMVHGLAILLALEDASPAWPQMTAEQSIEHLIEGLMVASEPI